MTGRRSLASLALVLAAALPTPLLAGIGKPKPATAAAKPTPRTTAAPRTTSSRLRPTPLRGTRAASLYKRGNPAARKKFIADLMARMTLQEKVGQLNQSLLGAIDINPALSRFFTDKDEIRAGRVGSLLGMSDVDKINEIQKVFVEETRLGIPAFIGYDAIHGMFTNFGTNLGFASSFDPKLIREIYRSIGREVGAAGIHVAYSPMVDLVRGRPMWGRGMEGYGEDPVWGARVGYEAVRGLQEMGIAATPKHFAGYGFIEDGAGDYSRLRIGKDEMGEVLRPFRSAIQQAGARAVMWGFGTLDGQPVTGHPELDKILRGSMGKAGKEIVAITDWDSGGHERGPEGHKVDHDLGESARRIVGKVDVDMVSKAFDKHLVAEVNRASGKRRAKLIGQIDDSVRRILALKYDLGLFERPYTDPARVKAVARSARHQAVALESALKSMVLLKNDRRGATPVLPLGVAARSIAVVGPLAASQEDPRGAWFSESKPENVVSALDGIRRHVAPGTKVVHAAGGTIERSSPKQIGAAVAAAKDADVTVVVVGEAWSMSGEAQTRSDLGLPGDQQKLVDAIAKTGKPYVVVLMNGRPLAIPEIKASAPAIVEAWQAGDMTGEALGRLLTGKANFSGKLPVSFPRFAGHTTYYNRPNTGRPALGADQEVVDGAPYRSRIYNGKKGNVAPVETTPLFSFGEGLSYTTYDYKDLELSASKIGKRDTLTVRAKVKNTGQVAGEEIVQLYVGDDVRSASTPPLKELKHFERVTLAPGEEKTVEFKLGKKELGFLDHKLRNKLEAGTFSVWLAPSSVGGLKGSFEVVGGK
jgi:beta-glucosidase